MNVIYCVFRSTIAFSIITLIVHLLKIIFSSHRLILKGNVIELEENGYLKTKHGFPEERKIRIRAEEIAYNKKFRPYKILWIDQPLMGNPNSLAHEHNLELDAMFTMTNSDNLSENIRFLKYYKEHKPVLHQLNEELKRFCSSYLFLPDYLPDAEERIKNIINETANKLINVNSLHRIDHRIIDSIWVCTEMFVMSELYKYIYPSVSHHFQHMDRRMENKLQYLKQFSAEDFGCRSELNCNLLPAVVELCSLNMFKTPMEKLHCLKRTVDEIVSSVQSHLNITSQKTNGSKPIIISSDDLLLLLVVVVCQARVLQPKSNLYFIDNFRWYSSNKDELGFVLVTFSAALEYIYMMKIPSEVGPSNTNSSVTICPSEMERIYINVQKAFDEMQRTPRNKKLAEYLRSGDMGRRPPQPDVIPQDKQQDIRYIISTLETSVNGMKLSTTSTFHQL